MYLLQEILIYVIPCSLDNKITKQLDVVKVNKLHFVGEKITFCYLLVNLGFLFTRSK